MFLLTVPSKHIHGKDRTPQMLTQTGSSERREANPAPVKFHHGPTLHLTSKNQPGDRIRILGHENVFKKTILAEYFPLPYLKRTRTIWLLLSVDSTPVKTEYFDTIG